MNRRIALIAVAIVLALVGTVAVYSYAHNADQRAIKKTRAAHVLIVEKQVPSGTTWADAIKNGYFKEEKIPIDSAPSNALSDLQASVPVDEVANANIAAGQVVVRPMFGEQVAVTGAVPIPKGKIAVSVEISDPAGVAGYVQYQSKVAVFATYKIKAVPGAATGQPTVGGTDLYVTKLLLPRADVIAVSQKAATDVTGAKASQNSSGNVMMTLALSQTEAEKVILSQKIGELYMALLSDNSVTAPSIGVYGAAVLDPELLFKTKAS
jgi:pilus assembly protein CpaB